jgi:L-glutamine-phosphate cytidylyltransferase
VKVALLAAGLGSRLGTLTTELPKALVQVGPAPLLLHALRFAQQLAPREIVVVGGFGFPQVAAVIEEARKASGGAPITLVENTNFRQGNILSLQAARPLLDDDFVLLNVDHIYRPSIAPLVTAPTNDVTAFIDTDRALGADDMKVQRDPEGRIKAIAKTLSRFDCGYVGMTRVPRAALPRYFSVVDAAIAQDGTAIHVERVLHRLAEAGQPPLCRDISGHGWLEVDTPDERASAEAALTGPGW